MKKYQCFLSEIFQFLEVKFSIYLNTRFRNDMALHLSGVMNCQNIV